MGNERSTRSPSPLPLRRDVGALTGASAPEDEPLPVAPSPFDDGPSFDDEPTWPGGRHALLDAEEPHRSQSGGRHV